VEHLKTVGCLGDLVSDDSQVMGCWDQLEIADHLLVDRLREPLEGHS
jgi:hypothetical protein